MRDEKTAYLIMEVLYFVIKCVFLYYFYFIQSKLLMLN